MEKLRRRMAQWRRHAEQPSPSHSHPQLRKRIAEVEARVGEVEEGLQENRLLSLRVAELTDVVTNLVGAAARGEDEFRRALDDYAKSTRRD
jgi:hypothetical protein